MQKYFAVALVATSTFFAAAQGAAFAQTHEPQPAENTPVWVGESGTASYYASRYNGRQSASGGRYDQMALTAAHPWLPFGTKVASKSGRARRGRMDAGIVFHRDQPVYVLAAFTDQVPETMPDGLPGYSAVFATIARLSRTCWDALV